MDPGASPGNPATEREPECGTDRHPAEPCGGGADAGIIRPIDERRQLNFAEC